MHSVTLLIGQFLEGSSAAFSGLFSRFFPDAVRLASRGSSRRRGSVADDEDIAQCVFLSLYRDVRRQRPLAECLSDRQTLLAALATLTRQQLRRRWRDGTRQCRDMRRTVRATDFSRGAGADPFDRLLGPWSLRWLEEIESQETLQHLLALLAQPRYQAVVELSVRGYELPEIARELGRSLRTVQRYLAEIETIWQEHTALQTTPAGQCAAPPNPANLGRGTQCLALASSLNCRGGRPS